MHILQHRHAAVAVDTPSASAVRDARDSWQGRTLPYPVNGFPRLHHCSLLSIRDPKTYKLIKRLPS